MKSVFKKSAAGSTVLLLSVLLLPLFYSNNITSAESYESSVGVSFTLNPTINVTVSGDLTIPNLTPGDYKDSNNITVTASSNSIAGYNLYANTGNSSNNSNELRKDGTDTTNKFISLSGNKASLSAFDENNNTWGYSWCNGTCNAGTDPSLWVSGSIGSTATGYNGLPIYTTDSPIQLINTATAGSGATSIDQRGQNVDYSICPAGWTLPTQPQFSILTSSYNSSASAMLVDSPTTATENTISKLPGFLLSGLYATTAGDFGVIGNYWSSTAHNAQVAYVLSLYSSDASVLPNNGGFKYIGFTVRCLRSS